jgi:hypothetical protein
MSSLRIINSVTAGRAGRKKGKKKDKEFISGNLVNETSTLPESSGIVRHCHLNVSAEKLPMQY